MNASKPSASSPVQCLTAAAAWCLLLPAVHADALPRAEPAHGLDVKPVSSQLIQYNSFQGQEQTNIKFSIVRDGVPESFEAALRTAWRATRVGNWVDWDFSLHSLSLPGEPGELGEQGVLSLRLLTDAAGRRAEPISITADGLTTDMTRADPKDLEAFSSALSQLQLPTTGVSSGDVVQSIQMDGLFPGLEEVTAGLGLHPVDLVFTGLSTWDGRQEVLVLQLDATNTFASPGADQVHFEVHGYSLHDPATFQRLRSEVLLTLEERNSGDRISARFDTRLTEFDDRLSPAGSDRQDPAPSVPTPSHTQRPMSAHGDERTGLRWQVARDRPIDWRGARTACDELGAGWQLPSGGELETLHDPSGARSSRCGTYRCSITNRLQLPSPYVWSREEENTQLAWQGDLGKNFRGFTARKSSRSAAALCVLHRDN